MEIVDILVLVFTIILGLCVGSFLNVCIYRIPNHNFLSKNRSYCPKCKHELKWYDNIPVFSFVFLGGKCRYCKEKISPIYPFVELLNLGTWLAIFFTYRSSYILIIYYIVLSTLIVMSFLDIKTREIPDTIHIIILILALISFAPIDDIMWQSKLIGAVCVSVPLLIIALITGGIGGADIKLFFVLGLLLGVGRIVITFFIGTVLAGLVGIVILIVMKKKGRKYELPFGPFIAIGAFVSMLAGTPIINYYTQLFTAFI